MESASAIRKVAFLGDYLPRKCGIATFTTDLRCAMAAEFPAMQCLVHSPRLWFDTRTGLLVRMEYGASSAVLQLDWADYRDIRGLMVPFKWREAGTENWVVECREVERNEPIDDVRFARPAEVK